MFLVTGQQDNFSSVLGKTFANAYIEKVIGIKTLIEKVKSVFENSIQIDESIEKKLEKPI